MTLPTRLATPTDAAHIRDLIESAFRAADPRPNWTGDLALGARFHVALDDILTRITDPESAILIAMATATANSDSDSTSTEPIIACVSMRRHGPDFARLSYVAVAQGHQQSGLGRRVLGLAEEHCRRVWGVKKVGLNALDTRLELIKWYQRCGYVATGEVTRFELPPDLLCFVEMEKVVG
ncbi:GNAT family acetyltransferase [Aspergillus saccharolyticus JOP 1030-1]|uniref:GNAT family acetyltransferase n=1 Tax=Aspergillus saccharolyticus JOP 1030-1 TaxID=1450539 RepID=A0A318ZJW7_9EURO|nr:GNAT family acetyltransferase [Aspergillus saccharolyticus JOP 1030-1]PYH47095.1 GNAT family acetyltransferase [Aspergillus saccharolyticus JOP 1030-1]